jgi:hypothetical protein
LLILLQITITGIGESAARLLLSTEFCEQNGFYFYKFAQFVISSLKPSIPIQSKPNELLFAKK